MWFAVVFLILLFTESLFGIENTRNDVQNYQTDTENFELLPLLQKMDRRMQQMESTISMLQRTLSMLQSENSLLNQRLADLENNQRTVSNKTHSHKLLNATVRRLVMDSEQPVAFLAAIVNQGKVEHLGVNQNIIFDTVLTNVGGSFNVNHGIFTVPHSGIYLISATVLSWVDTEVHACIMVNGKRTVSIFGHGSAGRHEQGTQVAVLQLAVGDTVTVENIDTPDTPVYGNRYTSFTGVLLYPS